MLEFPYTLFSGTPEFPVHLQYGYHEQTLAPHAHEDFHELTIVLDGKALHIVGEDRYPISKGSVFVVGQHQEHSFEQTAHLSICNIMFRSECFAHSRDIQQIPGFQALFVLEPQYAQNSHFVSKLHLSDDEITAAESQIEFLLHEYSQKCPGWQDTVLSGFLMFCVRLSRSYPISHDTSIQKLAAAAAYIESHFTEKISLSELTALSGYSERQFIRRFHAAFGSTPTGYITSLRMKRAKVLLEETALPVSEISWRCGYDDQNYFTRIFRKYTGYPPTTYRELFQFPSY